MRHSRSVALRTLPEEELRAVSHFLESALPEFIGVKEESEAAQEDEEFVHSHSSDDVKKVIEGKRILVLVDMLDELGFPNAADLGVSMAAGFPVVGDIAKHRSFSRRT